ncbi:MAG: transposase, partial [Chitinophagaceae bacterium]
KRDSMSIDLYSERFFQQKLDYIHSNPCQPQWTLALHPAEYKYSSAGFYEDVDDPFDMITHYVEI